jgi:predicted DNA-binding protein
MTPEQVNDLLDTLTPVPTTPAQETELLAMLPPLGEPEGPLNVVRSLRLPADLNRRLEAAATAQNVPTSVFIRHAIESVLAGRVRSNLVSLDDVYRALSAIPKAAA